MLQRDFEVFQEREGKEVEKLKKLRGNHCGSYKMVVLNQVRLKAQL